ncbi:putative proline--tRNA ligase [Maudiozyma humilis]|uniref:proline--tRNA ligase n=1 Tax=Maudiozyma humilis TaxID=51915 RepID=A0AAV5RZU4_MAUHU|nr:putative proline--tRNA ligase [Kazachstania humilis]
MPALIRTAQQLCRRGIATLGPKAPLGKQVLKEETTPALLEQLGFFHKTQSGLFHMLPLGMRTIGKLEGIIHAQLQANNDGELVALSSLSTRALWEATGRWANTELFKLKDSRKNEFCLVATCEEDITALLAQSITSYKDMPALVYQIGRKYRDELRPRSGLLRAREFVMMDAYSFAQDDAAAAKMFQDVNDTFAEVFHELKVPVVRAWADSGDIGGDQSIEYHLPLATGESTILTCDHGSCGHVATNEKAVSFPRQEAQAQGDVAVKYALSEDHATLVCFYYPDSRQLNWNLAKSAMEGDLDSALRERTNEQVLAQFQQENEDMMFSKIIRVMDCRIHSRSNFPDFPLRSYLKNNFGQIDGVSLVTAEDGEVCGVCNEGTLHAAKSIEVAHTFNLDTKYTKPLDVRYTDKNNSSVDNYVKMGCYGIGVTRVIASVAELLRDQHGLRWPAAIAPYRIAVVSNNRGENSNFDTVVKQLKTIPHLSTDIMSRQFPPSMSMGAQISLSHASGIPVTVIVGSRSWPRVEVEVRGRHWTHEGQPEPRWKQQYASLREKYNWDATTSKDAPFHEKHTVAHEHLPELLDILLADM